MVGLRTGSTVLAKNHDGFEALQQIAGTGLRSFGINNVAFTQQGGNIAGQRPQPCFVSLEQQMGQSWMSRQCGHCLARGGNHALIIERVQCREQLPCLRQCTRRRRIKPDKIGGITCAPLRKLQRQRCQIGGHDFRHCVRLQATLRRFGPQTIAVTWRQTSGASGTLLGRGA